MPGGEALFVGQPFFDAGPGLRLRRTGAGPGHALFHELLGTLFVLELDQLAAAAAAGKDYEIGPLREPAERPGWLLQSRLDAAPDRYRLTRADHGQTGEGNRQELLLTLELATRIAVQSVDTRQERPSWVARSRQAHRALRQALRGQALYQPE